MKRVPLRRRLFVLVAAGLLPLAAMSGLALMVLYEQQRGYAERTGLEVARALSTAVDAELRRTLSVLEVLSTSSWLEQGDLEGFRERAQRAHATQKHWNSVILYDVEGREVIDTGRPGAPPQSIPIESESLQLALKERAPVVGYLAKDVRGRWGIPVRVPVMRGDQLKYVLTAVLAPEAMLEVLRSTRVPGDWVVAVSDAKGLRVARTQSAEQSIGTPFSPTLVEMMARGGPEGIGETRNSEGVHVFTAYTRARDTGWVTAVGRPVEGITAYARQSFITFGSGIALSIALGLLAALTIARSINAPMAQLRDAALRVGRGERLPTPDTDIREIQDVANALAASEAERARIEAEREELLRSEQAARAAAEGANRAKDEFLAMLGHELRNPLGAISNAAAILEHAALDEPRKQDARRIINRQVTHLTRLTDDLLDAGRAVMGKIVLQRRPVDLAAAARQALATLWASERTQKHRIEEDLAGAWVAADAIRLDQIISNLVVNATKYSAPGSAIRVSVRREGGEAVLRVADEGIGIAPELVPRVFDLFVQGDRQLDRSLGGLGIGLTLVRRLAEMHGGSAEVRSDGIDKGSEFVVRLPAIDPPSHPEPVSGKDAPAGASRLDILVVEDNADARETLGMLLEMGGHRVFAEPDGESGLETALRQKPAVMLVDVGLPRMDGYEVARRIRAADGWPRRPFLVAITGYGQPADRDRALAAGFDTHLAKPVEPQRLLDLIASAMPTWPSGPSG